MQITINGEEHTLEASIYNLAELVKKLEIDPAKIAIEQNRCLVSSDRFVKTPIKDGDELEIVAFVGGG